MGKLIPPRADLDALPAVQARRSDSSVVEQELAKPDGMRVPADLIKQVRTYLAEHPEVPWDVAVATIAGWTNRQE